MRAERSASAAGVAALLIALLAPPLDAQDRSRERPPIVRVYSENGAIESNYVTPAIELSEDAYVFAVSMDLDGQIQVLHPDFPGISVRILQHKQLRLPNFFAGFSRSGGTFDGSGRYVSSFDDYAGSDYDTRGTVIALASRAPFNLERVESDGDWNMSEIRHLIEHRAPASAAYALAEYLGAKGEPIGTDYMRFAPARRHYDYAQTALYACDMYPGGYSPGLALSRLMVLNRVSQLRRGGQRVSILGYDFCGMPIVAYGPSLPNSGFRPTMPPRNPRDTTFRDSVRPPRSGPRAGRVPRAAAIGTFPVTRRAEPPQMGDVMITAPTLGRKDPREIIFDRNEARGSASADRNRFPGERGAQPRTESGFIGTMPTREYPRPVPREAAPQRPEPTRGPDHFEPRPVAPPRVIYERPSSPPPPPPRTQSEPRSRPVQPNPVPPPRH